MDCRASIAMRITPKEGLKGCHTHIGGLHKLIRLRRAEKPDIILMRQGREVIKKLLLILALALISTSVMAEWSPVSKNGTTGVTGYLDFSTIRKSGDKVKMWSLFDYNSMQEIEGVKFQSQKMQIEFDCKEEQSRNLYIILLSENMGSGKVVYNNDAPYTFSPISPGSISETMWKIACDKQ